MAGKTILILGGGIGGQVAANLLRRKIARDHRVILIDRKGGYVFSPSLLWLIVGKRKLDQISRSLESLTQKGIEVVQAEVTRIDPSARVSPRRPSRDCGQPIFSTNHPGRSGSGRRRAPFPAGAWRS